jgi:hypothetical protein
VAKRRTHEEVDGILGSYLGSNKGGPQALEVSIFVAQCSIANNLWHKLLVNLQVKFTTSSLPAFGVFTSIS